MNSYVIDGNAFSTLEEFAEHFSARVLSGAYKWNGNLDAFNDILRGGFGTPEAGFELVWQNHAISQERLGYKETIRQLEKRLSLCHPDNRQSVASQLGTARAGSGPTVFDWLVDIIREHGPGGVDADDQVLLSLR